MQPRFVDAADLSGLLTMEEAIDELEAAFGGVLPQAPARSHLDVGEGDLLVMPAWSQEAAGVKLVTVAPANPARGLPLIHGIYVLFDQPTLQPVASFDAGPLTALRTAAVSGVATRHLARPDARRLVLFGAGTQARAHLDAMTAVRPIRHVAVVSRSRAPAERLVQSARERGLEAEVGTPEAVSEADLVCTCTTSAEPVFDGTLLAPGTHVNAVGSYKPAARELDDAAVTKATVTIDVGMATEESGDLAIPLAAGVIGRERISTLADVISGAAARRSDDDITVFKSVGVAFEDLVIAVAAAKRL